MVESSFDSLRSALRTRQSPGSALAWQMAWVEFRSLFNKLIQEPVWSGSPSTVDLCLSRDIQCSDFEPLDSWMPAAKRIANVRGKFKYSLDETLAMLELYYICIRAGLRATEPKLLRSYELSSSNCSGRIDTDVLSRKSEFEALLRELRDPPAAVSAVLLHGSLADGMVADGFSDADVLCFIAEPTGSGAVFKEAYRWLFQLQFHLFNINPLMHHGPMIAFVGECGGASEAHIPSALLSNGRWLAGSVDMVWYRETGIAEVLSFESFEHYFESTHVVVPDVRSAFDLLWWTSSILMLPLLLEQLQQGRSVYKRECLSRTQWIGSGQFDVFFEEVSSLRISLAAYVSNAGLSLVGCSQSLNPACLIAEAKRLLPLQPDQVRFLGLTDGLMFRGYDFWMFVKTQVLSAVPVVDCAVPPNSRMWRGKSFVRAPIHCDVSCYDEARSVFLARAASNPSVRAVYEFGAIGCPGLSDMDFCVVLDDEFSGVPVELCVKEFPENIKYLLDHDPLFVSVSSLGLLSAVFPIFGATLIYGQSVIFPLTTEFSHDVVVAVVTNKSLRKYPIDMDTLMSSASLNVRTILAFLHSSSHMAHCIELLGVDVPAAIQNAIRYDGELRSSFLSGQDVSSSDLYVSVRHTYLAAEALLNVITRYWGYSPLGHDVAKWSLTEALRWGLHHHSGLPLRGRRVSDEYLSKRRQFVVSEAALGRFPSSYIYANPFMRADCVGSASRLQSFDATYVSGWYSEESSHYSMWRWCSGVGVIAFSSVVSCEVAISASICSLHVPNVIVFFLDDSQHVVYEVPVGGFAPLGPIRFRLPPGRSVLHVVSGARGQHTVDDDRVLAFAVRDLVVVPTI